MTDKKIINVKRLEAVSMPAAQYYMAVKNKEQPLRYIHKDMIPYTTNGILIYQEQIMKFLVDIVGYSLEESDIIRNAIAKKKHEVMMASFDRIRKATLSRGWTQEQADTICQQVQAFSKYSFNRSHSRCYAELGYITMYLKHHYPLEWWTSVLNNTNNEDKLRFYITLLGNSVSSPSILNPSNRFTISGNKILSPISAIKGIGGGSVRELMNKAPYTSFDDFLDRINNSKVNSGHFCSMVKARAFDVFMDQSKPYSEARIDLLTLYMNKRKKKELADGVMETDPLKMFLMERETNTCFNKCLLSDPYIYEYVIGKFPGLKPTGNKSIPLRMGDFNILRNVRLAEKVIENKDESPYGLIMLYQGSSIKTGLNKHGKPYSMLKVILSDGYNEIECVLWDKKQPLKWPINSIVYVLGTFKPGWKTNVSMTIEEIEVI